MRSYGYQVDGYPALFDEWAHVPCYTYSTLRTDPNIREFWGKSLDLMWKGTFNAQGALGGAIWGFIDETFMVPEPKQGTSFWKEFAHTAKPQGFQGNAVGYGEWGIIDVWRREKPEFWSTKKAYSPIKIETTQISDFETDMPIYLNVYNRFDHTYLNEIDVVFTYNGLDFTNPINNIAPHSKGYITVPAQKWVDGSKITVKFYYKDGELIDAYNIQIGKNQKVYTANNNPGKSLTITNDENFTVIEGENFKIPFNNKTGLIENAVSNGEVVIDKGPFLKIGRAHV